MTKNGDTFIKITNRQMYDDTMKNFDKIHENMDKFNKIIEAHTKDDVKQFASIKGTLKKLGWMSGAAFTIALGTVFSIIKVVL